MPRTKVNVRGFEVTTASPRRYLVVAMRPETHYENGFVYVPFADVRLRTDNLKTAHKNQRAYGFGRGCFAVVVDTKTGEEV